MLKKIGLGVGAVIAMTLGYAAIKPPHYVISREIRIQAGADKLFPLMNNPKVADEWGPWTDIDPQVKMTYSGPEQGVGAKASWTSPGQMGVGSATITESAPNRIAMHLEYTSPMPMTQESVYLLEQEAGTQATKVTWRVEGDNSFVSRLFGIFVDVDKMVGGMFEQGLNKLKNKVESGAH